MKEEHSESSPPRQPHVVFLSFGHSFPHGMAATHRASLIARALTAGGWRVTHWTMRPTERPGAVRNDQPQGEHEGIPYVYTCGTTVRPRSFLRRRWVYARGVLSATLRLIRLRRLHEVQCVYLWVSPQKWSPLRQYLFTMPRVLGIPVCMEINEFPWPFKPGRSLVERSCSPMSGAQGIVVISGFLEEWARQESVSRHFRSRIVKVPILVDSQESMPIPSMNAGRRPEVLYASYEGYDTSLVFVIQAMEHVWRIVPDCTLVLTGWSPEALQRLLSQTPALGTIVMRDNIRAEGYLPRPEYLARCASAGALLVPLFDDIRSRARFPTKLGEFLLTGRPVVASDVGEVAALLKDRESAYLVPAGEVRRFATAIVEALTHESEAAMIGARGRLVAEETLDYRVHVESLATHFRETAGLRGGTPDSDHAHWQP